MNCDDVHESWQEFLNPEALKSKLIFASLYITAYEILKDIIIERIEFFYSSVFREGKFRVDPEYKTEVLSLDAKNPPDRKNKLNASLLWLKEMSAIDDKDIELFYLIRESRNELAHEMAELVAKSIDAKYPERFSDMITLLNKIEVWWAINFDLAIDPDIMVSEINEDDISPGIIISLRLMYEIALGNDDESWCHYKRFFSSHSVPEIPDVET